MSTFSRDDLERYLRLLVGELRAVGATAEIRVVGGAALALRYFDRASTMDIDVMVIGDSAILAEAVLAVARQNGISEDWLNEAARKYVPSYGQQVEWHTVYEVDGITVQIAPAEALLAMKLLANRPGRDDKDIARLAAICGITTVDGAEELFASFYPGDALTARAVRMVERALANPPEIVVQPPPINLGSER